jgi:hypothetical protein
MLVEWKKELAGRHTTKEFHSVHDLGLLVPRTGLGVRRSVFAPDKKRKPKV